MRRRKLSREGYAGPPHPSLASLDWSQASDRASGRKTLASKQSAKNARACFPPRLARGAGLRAVWSSVFESRYSLRNCHAARAHTALNTSSALPASASPCVARRRDTHLPRAAERPPSNISLPHRLAQADEVPPRPRHSKHGCRPVTLGGLVPLYLSPQLHHQAQRRTIARRYSHIELRPCPRNAGAWVCWPFSDSIGDTI